MTKEIEDIKNRIESTKGIIKNYEVEKGNVEKYIRIIQETTSYDTSLKEKIVKLSEIQLSKRAISEVLNCSYRYILNINSR